VQLGSKSVGFRPLAPLARRAARRRQRLHGFRNGLFAWPPRRETQSEDSIECCERGFASRRWRIAAQHFPRDRESARHVEIVVHLRGETLEILGLGGSAFGQG